MRYWMLLTLAVVGSGVWGAPLPDLTADQAVQGIRWFGQNDLRISIGGMVIWIDPVYESSDEKADLILITHNHGDHYNSDKIDALTGLRTKVLVGFDDPSYDRIRPGDTKSFGEVTVEAVPAYNRAASFHPKNQEFCGFVISAQGVRVYVTGDTELVPEMKNLRCDIVLLPLGQTYTFRSLQDAEQAVLDVRAKIAIPVHYGMYEGSEADADRFVSDLNARGVTAIRLPRQPQ